uniref:NR LBD domain-containing protein n=1 Tax=Romanomermis culicivorax TaxID=13658 RepID=A0A915IMF7_ROMCU
YLDTIGENLSRCLPRVISNISNVDQLLLNRNQNSSHFPNFTSTFGITNFAAGQLFNDAVDAAISQELDVIGTPSGGAYRLSALEQNRLAELMAANEIFEEPMESGDARSLTDFVNLMDIGIRRIIRMAKRIDAFKNLCKDDQIALLKGGCVELMVLRGVMAFDPVKDTWRGPKSYCIKSENVREVKGDVYDEYKKYFHSFEQNLRTNESIMVILSAITLFICERPNVQHKDLISSEQAVYVELLKNYLNSIYDQKRATSAYERLMSNLDDLHRLTERVISIFLHVNPKDVEPLLLEMFDWKR